MEGKAVNMSMNGSRDAHPDMVRIYHADSGNLTPETRVIKTLAEWESVLTPIQFRVARLKCSEPPFSGAYHDLHDRGIYRCACCGTDLFSSETKFESGTGWPSFSEPVHRNNVTFREDLTHGMVRTEVLCARCDAHLGHVFDDGPLPAGTRYCMNSASLTFIPGAALGNTREQRKSKQDRTQ